MSSSKEGLKRRVITLETVVSEGIDKLILEVHRINNNIHVLAGAMEELDANIAALRAIMVISEIATDDEIDAKRLELGAIRDGVRKEAEEAAEKLAKKKEEKYANIDPELMRMHKAAEDASEEHPEDAFIFGG